MSRLAYPKQRSIVPLDLGLYNRNLVESLSEPAAPLDSVSGTQGGTEITELLGSSDTSSTLDSTLKDYGEKVSKLIPAEVIAAYLASIAIVPAIKWVSARPFFTNSLFFLFWVLTGAYVYLMRDTTGISANLPIRRQLLLALIAFPIWAFSTSGATLIADRYDPAIMGIILILFTVISGTIPLADKNPTVNQPATGKKQSLRVRIVDAIAQVLGVQLAESTTPPVVAQPANSTTPPVVVQPANSTTPPAVAQPANSTTPTVVVQPANSTTPTVVVQPANNTTPPVVVQPANSTTQPAVAQPANSTTPTVVVQPADSTTPPAVAQPADITTQVGEVRSAKPPLIDGDTRPSDGKEAKIGGGVRE